MLVLKKETKHKAIRENKNMKLFQATSANKCSGAVLTIGIKINLNQKSAQDWY